MALWNVLYVSGLLAINKVDPLPWVTAMLLTPMRLCHQAVSMRWSLSLDGKVVAGLRKVMAAYTAGCTWMALYHRLLTACSIGLYSVACLGFWFWGHHLGRRV